MSDVAKGAARVGSVLTALHKHGFRCARISASGQRRGARRQEDGIAGDVLALAPPHSGLPHLLAEVGGEKKIVTRALDELRCDLPPGFAPIVARCIRRRWRWHVDTDSAHDTLSDALDALRVR